MRYKRDYKPGEQGEFSYKDEYQFPKNYEPWRFNYNGSFLMAGFFAAFCMCSFRLYKAYYFYEKTYLDLTGRTKRDPERKYYKI